MVEAGQRRPAGSTVVAKRAHSVVDGPKDRSLRMDRRLK